MVCRLNNKTIVVLPMKLKKILISQVLKDALANNKFRFKEVVFLKSNDITDNNTFKSIIITMIEEMISL